MRTIKTAIAVSLSIFIAQTLKLQSPFFVGIAAIISMKASVSESLSIGKDRMLGTVFGAIVAIIFSYIAPTNVISIGIGIVIIIYICNLLGWGKAIQISTMVFLVILLNYTEGSRINYAIYRTMDTLIGLIIGTLINYFFVPPDTYYENLLKKSIGDMYHKLKDVLENLIWNKEKTSLDELKKHLLTIEEDYKILNKDSKLKIRKQKEISTSKSSFEKAINSIENIYSHLTILFHMEKTSPLYENNKNSLEKLFRRKLEEETILDQMAIIYNYHIRKILDELKTLELIVGLSEAEYE